MRILGEIVGGLKALVRGRAAEAELDEEIAHFQEMRAEELRRQGLSEAEARRQAAVEMGPGLKVREEVRESGWESHVETLISDLRYSARRLARRPGFVAACALTLALGIGATTAIFAVVYGVLLKPLPYPRAERLVAVWHTAPGVGIAELGMAPAQYFYYRAEGKSFDGLAMWTGGVANVTGANGVEEAAILQATHGFLPLLGVKPALGRGFTEADDDPAGERTVMVSDRYWREQLQADRGVVGRTLTLDGRGHTVIGVLPAEFRFTERRAALIVPLRFSPQGLRLTDFSYDALGRLRAGVTLEQASAEIRQMLPLIPRRFPLPPSFGPRMLEEARIGPALKSLKDDQVGNIGKTLWVLMGTLGILLVIACANVANLLLVRAGGRAHELAVRSALGAGRRRLARELLLESLLLGLAGGALGLVLAQTGLQALVASEAAGLPRLSEVQVDWVVVVFTVGVSVGTSLLFGLLPVWKYARPAGAAELREGGRTAGTSRDTSRTRYALVVGQVALALMLVVSAGLMIRSVRALGQVDVGFRGAEKVLTVRLTVPEAQMREGARVTELQRTILERLNATPGYRAAAINQLPLEGGSQDPVFAADREYRDGAMPAVRRFKSISPGYAEAIGARVVAGREFTWAETMEARPVALVSENLARELWGRPEAALGKRVRTTPDSDWSEVVGVLADLRDDGLDKPAKALVYWPLQTRRRAGEPAGARRSVALLVRSENGTNAERLEEVRRIVAAVAPAMPLASVRGLGEIVERSMARRAFTLTLLGLAGAMALLLGLVGIYGVIAYSVAQRTREIGIRLALGAPLEGVTRLFVRNGLRLAVAGVGLGLAGAVGLTRLMRAVLFEVSPTDPLTYTVAAGSLVAAALVASYLPARRAARIDPMRTLRAD